LTVPFQDPADPNKLQVNMDKWLECGRVSFRPPPATTPPNLFDAVARLVMCIYDPSVSVERDRLVTGATRAEQDKRMTEHLLKSLYERELPPPPTPSGCRPARECACARDTAAPAR
jgi:hypothetical protein